MRLSLRGWLRIVLVVIAGVLLWVRFGPHREARRAGRTGVPDLSVSSPLNQKGGAPAPAESYEVYSALYRAPAGEPLVFAQDSITDIPQVEGSCLKPSTAQEHEMADAFVAANRESHRWDQKFMIPGGYRMLSRPEAAQAQSCMESHGQDAAKCDRYKGIRHVRFLGVPGFDGTHTRALVSVIRMCGSFCGSGGIFAVEKTAKGWQRAETTDFTRDCSWMY